jgi:hypothetical protein
VATKQNRTPWIVIGLLGCLAFCLLLGVAGSTYLLVRSMRATPIVGLGGTASPRITTPLPPKHYDLAEITFDYPAGYETFADFVPATWGTPYKPGHDKEFDADILGGVLLPFTSLAPGITDKYLTSVLIYRRALPPGSSLKLLYEQRYAGGYPKSNSISDRTLTVDGVMALEKMYREPRGSPWFKFREVLLEKSSKIYIISCRTMPSWFDDLLP